MSRKRASKQSKGPNGHKLDPETERAFEESFRRNRKLLERLAKL